MIYPYYAPIILTNDLFTDYGGNISPYSTKQLNIAYWLAESLMTEHVGSYLKPTRITGTYPYEFPGERLRMDHGQILSVDAVSYKYGGCDCAIVSETGCAFILDPVHGYLILEDTVWSLCGCSTTPKWPINVNITDTSGYSSAMVYQPSMLLALTLAAKVNLEELYDPFSLEGGAGDPGVQEWSDMSHREVRTKLGSTIFGKTPLANKISRLVSGYSNRPAIKLGG